MWHQFIEFIDVFFYFAVFIVCSPFLIYLGVKRYRDQKKEQFEKRSN